MIDTVSLRHSAPLPPPSELAERGFIAKYSYASSDSERQRWRLNPPKYAETLPRLTWSSSPSGDWLTTEVSVPKFLFSTNLIQLTDANIQRGLDGISRFVSTTAGVNFDARSALVGRVDYCHNFAVGEGNKIPYLSAAAHASIPRMKAHRIESSLAFTHSSQKILLYDKHDEVASRAKKGQASDGELRESVGLLRLEISHFTSDACRRLSKSYSLPGRSADLLLHSSIAHQEIERGLKMLGLDDVTETVDARLDALREVYGETSHSRCLAGFLYFLDRYGEDFWQHGIGGYKRSTYFKYRRELKNAGVWLRSDRQLPPLRLVRNPREQLPKAVQSMSNTISVSPATVDSQSLYEKDGGGRGIRDRAAAG